MEKYQGNQPLTLSMREASAYSGLSTSVLYAAVHSAEIPVIRTSSKTRARIRFVRQHLEQFVLERTQRQP